VTTGFPRKQDIGGSDEKSIPLDRRDRFVVSSDLNLNCQGAIMTSTDINGSPILILSLGEAVLLNNVFEEIRMSSFCVCPLGEKVSRFLEEANENQPDQRTG
jgi:hypothetical protein